MNREVALLVQEGVTTTSTRQNIGRIICHENVHMWFGNEVSPRSWTYTWLNEGFANFFENYGTDLVSIIFSKYVFLKYMYVCMYSILLSYLIMVFRVRHLSNDHLVDVTQIYKNTNTQMINVGW